MRILWESERERERDDDEKIFSHSKKKGYNNSKKHMLYGKILISSHLFLNPTTAVAAVGWRKKRKKQRNRSEKSSHKQHKKILHHFFYLIIIIMMFVRQHMMSCEWEEAKWNKKMIFEMWYGKLFKRKKLYWKLLWSQHEFFNLLNFLILLIKILLTIYLLN